jgi:hypothetical protein
VRDEFQRLASPDLWKNYLDSKPPDPKDPTAASDAIRTDVETSLWKLHELRLGRALLDGIRAYTTSLTFVLCICLIGLILLVSTRPQPNRPILLLVATAGVFGAAFSMLSRLGQIPTKGDLVSRYPAASRRLVWVLTPILSLLEGVLGSVVLYFLFRADLIKGLLFPQFPNKLEDPYPFASLIYGTVGSATDGAKLLIWSFIAGFSERLVPDMLTRLAEQAQKTDAAPKKE